MTQTQSFPKCYPDRDNIVEELRVLKDIGMWMVGSPLFYRNDYAYVSGQWWKDPPFLIQPINKNGVLIEPRYYCEDMLSVIAIVHYLGGNNAD